MSMPTIKIEDIDLNQAMNNVIASIALEEAALSHILNAEGEKLQTVMGMGNLTFDQLREINTTVANVLSSISEIENALQSKLNAVVITPPPPVPPLSSELAAVSNGYPFTPPVGMNIQATFRKTFHSQGSSISHADNSTDFVINKAGKYQIYYQVYVDNPTHTVGDTVALDIGIFGSTVGSLADNTATLTGTLIENSIEATLPIGEIIKMGLGTTGIAAVTAVSPVIYFREIS
jgi:hypothetical protein